MAAHAWNIAVAILGTLTVWITVPLWVIAVLLFAWGLEPKRIEEFVGRLPYGSTDALQLELRESSHSSTAPPQ
jgi:hypothetical protein